VDRHFGPLRILVVDGSGFQGELLLPACGRPGRDVHVPAPRGAADQVSDVRDVRDPADVGRDGGVQNQVLGPEHQ
jgi:hypothetical protein